jgi:hypothetical protein
MKRGFFLLLLTTMNPGRADGLYIEGGLAYNPDAFGITSNTLARVALIYRTTVTDDWELDVRAEHESDPNNSGADDLISHEDLGITMRGKIW